jgi:hypothetical protein
MAAAAAVVAGHTYVASTKAAADHADADMTKATSDHTEAASTICTLADGPAAGATTTNFAIASAHMVAVAAAPVLTTHNSSNEITTEGDDVPALSDGTALSDDAPGVMHIAVGFAITVITFARTAMVFGYATQSTRGTRKDATKMDGLMFLCNVFNEAIRTADKALKVAVITTFVSQVTCVILIYSYKWDLIFGLPLVSGIPVLVIGMYHFFLCVLDRLVEGTTIAFANTGLGHMHDPLQPSAELKTLAPWVLVDTTKSWWLQSCWFYCKSQWWCDEVTDYLECSSLVALGALSVASLVGPAVVVAVIVTAVISVALMAASGHTTSMMKLAKMAGVRRGLLALLVVQTLVTSTRTQSACDRFYRFFIAINIGGVGIAALILSVTSVSVAVHICLNTTASKTKEHRSSSDTAFLEEKPAQHSANATATNETASLCSSLSAKPKTNEASAGFAAAGAKMVKTITAQKGLLILMVLLAVGTAIGGSDLEQSASPTAYPAANPIVRSTAYPSSASYPAATVVCCTASAFESSWGACTEKCDGGVQSKTRSVITAASFGGSACPMLEIRQACNIHPCADPCAVDVAASGSFWSSCTKSSCGTGIWTRTLNVDTATALEQSASPTAYPAANPIAHSTAYPSSASYPAATVVCCSASAFESSWGGCTVSTTTGLLGGICRRRLPLLLRTLVFMPFGAVQEVVVSETTTTAAAAPAAATIPTDVADATKEGVTAEEGATRNAEGVTEVVTSVTPCAKESTEGTDGDASEPGDKISTQYYHTTLHALHKLHKLYTLTPMLCFRWKCGNRF